MIKARGGLNGRDTVFLGLSFENLKRFREHPGDTFIRIKGEELKLDVDIVIFSGKTEEAMGKLLYDAAMGKTTRMTEH